MTDKTTGVPTAEKSLLYKTIYIQARLVNEVVRLVDQQELIIKKLNKLEVDLDALSQDIKTK